MISFKKGLSAMMGVICATATTANMVHGQESPIVIGDITIEPIQAGEFDVLVPVNIGSYDGDWSVIARVTEDSGDNEFFFVEGESDSSAADTLAHFEDIPLPSGSVMSIFVWDGFQDIKPLGESVEVSLANYQAVSNKTTSATYSSLNAALEAAKNGETVELLKNITSAASLEIPAGVTLNVPEGKQLLVGGTLQVTGTLEVAGTLSVDGMVETTNEGKILRGATSGEIINNGAIIGKVSTAFIGDFKSYAQKNAAHTNDDGTGNAFGHYSGGGVVAYNRTRYESVDAGEAATGSAVGLRGRRGTGVTGVPAGASDSINGTRGHTFGENGLLYSLNNSLLTISVDGTYKLPLINHTTNQTPPSPDTEHWLSFNWNAPENVNFGDLYYKMFADVSLANRKIDNKTYTGAFIGNYSSGTTAGENYDTWVGVMRASKKIGTYVQALANFKTGGEEYFEVFKVHYDIKNDDFQTTIPAGYEIQGASLWDRTYTLEGSATLNKGGGAADASTRTLTLSNNARLKIQNGLLTSGAQATNKTVVLEQGAGLDFDNDGQYNNFYQEGGTGKIANTFTAGEPTTFTWTTDRWIKTS